MKNVWNWLKKISKKPLFLPLFSVFLVLIINVVYDAAQGNYALEFFRLELKEGALYGRIIDILNRGSEAAILAIGMTLVVSSSAGTDISVGSVMSLAGSLCCMILAGFGVTHVRELGDLQAPIFVGVIAGIAVAGLCGLFNGFLVAKMKIQPMVATLIFFTAGRAIGLLLTNNKMVYIHLDQFKVFGGKLWIFPTPTVIAAACILIMTLILKTTSLGMYVQSVGINPKASRIAGMICSGSQFSTLPKPLSSTHSSLKSFSIVMHWEVVLPSCCTMPMSLTVPLTEACTATPRGPTASAISIVICSYSGRLPYSSV